jgi:GNAT superfamily N-acetyltransferase
MPVVDVIRTYLEMRSPDALRGASVPRPGLSLTRESPCAVATYRELYDRVGGRWHWRDRAAWSDAALAAHLAREDVAVWVLRSEGESAGFFELARDEDGSVEIAYFGLVPEAIGGGLGKYLLTRAVEEAWALGAERVWLHTCTLDGPAALPTYLARGFVAYRVEEYRAEIGG